MAFRAPHETLYGRCWCKSGTDEVQSLRNICCNVLIRDARLLRRVLHTVPAAFIRVLLARAVQDGRDRAAQLLVSVWPDRSLSLPDVLGGSCPLIHHPERIAAATAILRAFVDFALRGEHHHLRFLDATGFQVGPELLIFIKLEIETWRESLRSLRKHSRRSPRTLRCDIFVVGERSFTVLMSVLQHQLPKCVLRIDISNMQVEGVGETKLLQLLETLNPDALAGLGLAYNSVQNLGLSVILERLRCFPALTALDLSSNCISFIDARLRDCLSDSLLNMPLLQRLSLKSCRIGGQLGALIARCPPKMTHLDLSACGLQSGDLVAIGQMQSLTSLMLSDNNFSDVLPELVLPRLQVLDLSNCKLRPDLFVTLWRSVRASNSSLCLLDLAWNKFSVKNFAVILEDLESGLFPHLVHLWLPLPANPCPACFELAQRMNAVSPHLTVDTHLV